MTDLSTELRDIVCAKLDKEQMCDGCKLRLKAADEIDRLKVFEKCYADENKHFNQGYDTAERGQKYDPNADDFWRMGWAWAMFTEPKN